MQHIPRIEQKVNTNGGRSCKWIKMPMQIRKLEKNVSAAGVKTARHKFCVEKCDENDIGAMAQIFT